MHATHSHQDSLHRKPHRHTVRFYESDDALYETVGRYLGEGLISSAAVVVIATETHLQGFADNLLHAGFDVERARASGRLTLLEARQALSDLSSSDGMPDRARFDRTLRPVLAASRRSSPGANLFAYGEMVDLAYRPGAPEAALRLERLWNELALEEPFSLMCGYRSSHFPREAPGSYQEVCQLHDAPETGLRGPSEAASEYSVSLEPHRFGAMVSAPDADADRCYRLLYGRETPCPACPALRPAPEEWPRLAVVASPEHEGYTVMRAELTDRATARVRVQRVGLRELSAIRKQQLREVALNAHLTPRERDVFDRLVSGASGDEIARELSISPRTAKFHTANVLAKLGADSRSDLLRLLL